MRKKWTALFLILGIGGLLPSSSAQRTTHRDTRAGREDLPVYPGAMRRTENQKGTRTLELRNVSVRSARAAAYNSRDSLEQVLRFYQAVLRSQGAMIQCTGGTNAQADLSLDQKTLSRPESSEADQFAIRGIELKVKTANSQQMVVLRPTEIGTTFALVSIR